MRIRNYQQIIERSAYDVYRQLGTGLEKNAYHEALVLRLLQTGLGIDEQGNYTLVYDEKIINVNQATVLQVQTVMKQELKKYEELKFVNHLTRQKIEVGYIVDFSTQMMIKKKYRSDRLIQIN